MTNLGNDELNDKPTQLEEQQTDQHQQGSLLEILLVSVRLGLTSFGGPVAHLGYFYEEYIRKRKWMDEQSYADLVALCQFLPGPASSQVGIGIGLMRAGVWGGIVAFLGFTLPSILALSLFAMAVQGSGLVDAGWIQGLKIVAVAIVAHAILGMGQKLTPDKTRATLAVLMIIAMVMWQSALLQVVLILAAGLFGLLYYRNEKSADTPQLKVPVSRRTAQICLALFFSLLALLPILRTITEDYWLAVTDSFYRAGALVFGGGHVVLPLLEREVVPEGWVTAEQFLAGYGAAQAVPGPLFTFASYLGGVMNGWVGVIVATVAIFLPAFLLVMGTLPYWNSLRQNARMQGALYGVNAAVVGILAAALYDPIFTSAIQSAQQFALAILLFALLVLWKLPPWVIVLVGAGGGFILFDLLP